MVNFTVDQVRALMQNQKNLRNFTIVGEQDSQISDRLICNGGIILNPNYKEYRFQRDQRHCQWDGCRHHHFKSINTLMHYKSNIALSGNSNQQFLLNLVNFPQKAYYSQQQINSTLRIVDGALVVVDIFGKSQVKIGKMVKHIIQERVVPALMISGVERLILELKMDSQQIYQSFVKTVEMVNLEIDAFKSMDMAHCKINPFANVAFGSAKDGWAFTLSAFARMYAIKFGISHQKMVERLWGENYFDVQTKKWTKQAQTEDKRVLQRSFAQFIIDPIAKLISALANAKSEQYTNIIDNLQFQLTKEEGLLSGRSLVRTVFGKWLPLSNCLFEMMITHLPSPLQAQTRKTNYLYEGPANDPVSESMRKCDPKGPLIIYVSMMIQGLDRGRFYAIGRVFSGTVSSGQNVRIIGANYKLGKREDLFEKNIQRILQISGRRIQAVSDAPCGNIVALTGIDQYLIKNGTISSVDIPLEQTYPIRPQRFCSVPVLKTYVKPQKPEDLPRLFEGLRKLSRSNQLVYIQHQLSGEHAILACSQHHLNNLLDSLRDLSHCSFSTSEIYPIYKETVTSESSTIVMCRSQNRHNRIHAFSYPLHQGLSNLIDQDEISMKQERGIRVKRLCEQFGWEAEDAMGIWGFGPEDIGPNVIVNATKGIPYMNEIKDAVNSTFQYTTKEGVLCQENIRGVRFDIKYCELHSDAIHRGGGQIIPTVRRVFYALELLSKPSLLEPIFSCEITVPMNRLEGVYQCLSQRRGRIVEEVQIKGTSLCSVKSLLPVAESLGLEKHFEEATEGRATYSCIFNDWQLIKGLPFEDEQAKKLVLSIRKRKGLSEQLPKIADYLDSV